MKQPFGLKKLKKVDEARQNLLCRHLPQGSFRARTFEAMLKTATRYSVRVSDGDGSVDMLRMAWQRSRIELNTDDNQLVYLRSSKSSSPRSSPGGSWR